MAYLGFDTSNYTTSVALYFPEDYKIVQEKKLLPVREGERGLRQSDAVFHHTAQLHTLCSSLFSQSDCEVKAICASAFPRLVEGSYMPCFSVGLNTASCVSSALKIPLYQTSHQHGHILAALYSVRRLDLISRPFIAFHLSGGTTEALLVEPDEKEVFKCSLVAGSLDLKAGQAVDRVGLMLGLKFPCGAELDKLSLKSEKQFKIKPSFKGMDVSLSGVENKCKKMIENEEKAEDVARFCVEYICCSLEKMTELIIEKYGNLPLVYAGGVMSNSIISKKLSEKYGAYFAKSEFSCDNAAGVAIMGYLKDKKRKL